VSDASNSRLVVLAKARQDDLDKLVRSGTVAGVAALRPLRSAVRRAVLSAETPDQLRGMLLELVYQHGAEKLALQLGRARTIGQLIGQVAVQDEIEEG